VKLKVNAMRAVAFASLAWSIAAVSYAETHAAGVPELSSRAGAAYTLYIDFAGFNYNGTWSSYTPGSTQAYLGATSYTAAQQATIKNLWARISEAYSAFNVNVTTIDPAVAAGHSATDAQRQSYYDSTAKLMHSVVSGTGSWIPGAGGVSFVGTTQSTYTGEWSNGYHTNWIFADQASSNLGFISEATIHENGHGLSLYHQSDYSGNTLTNEYSRNGGATGNGSYAPIMGDSYYSQRGLWRVGKSSNGGTQNDMVGLLSNTGMGGYVEDGIGHSFSTATALCLVGDEVDYNLAKGIITPASTTNPNPIGEANYTSDYFLFATLGGSVTLTANDGSEFLTPGTADQGAMLDSVLRIYDSNKNLVASGVRSTDTLRTTYSGILGAGQYYAQIASVGGYTSTFDTTAKYYTMGSYFLTGSGFTAVPEPMTMIGLAIGVAYFARRRRKSQS
jgi:hypothetical protein